jgi:hypothetical protein
MSKPTPDELQDFAADAGHAMAAVCPPEIGFILIVTDFGAEGSFAYSSSIERRDVIALLGEARDRIREEGSR